jgi:peptidoglycan hydrolase-like protein with peptidoglycan-binding domain
MMKRFLLTTSILALTAGGALAQGMTPGGTAPGGMTPPAPSTNAPAPSVPSPEASGAMKGAASAAASVQSPRTVKEAQTALKEHGLYQGHVDGKIGPATKAAIAKFQKQKGLRQTAKLDSRTMNELLSGASSGDAGASGGAIGGGSSTMGGSATH